MTRRDPHVRFDRGRRRAHAAGDRRDRERDRGRRDRVARLHAGAPRPRLRERAGRARHLHEHPLRHRVLQPVPHRLGRSRRDGPTHRDPPRRARVPRPHAHLHGAGHRGAARRRRGHRRGRVQRDQRPRRARLGHRDARACRSRARERALRAAPRSPASARPSSRRSRAAASCSSRARRCRPRSTTPGSTPADVDGLVTFTLDTNEEMEVARSVGIQDLSMFSRISYGGGASAATVMQAAMAVATGVAEVVVCYRAFNERSGMRFGNFGARDDRAAAVALDVRAVRADDAGVVGRAAGAPVHAPVRRDQRGLRRRSRSSTARTRRPIPTRGSTSGRSRSTTIRPRGGSSSRCCGCSTAARRATAASRWW